MHLERPFRHGAFGVDILVIGAAGWHVVDQLDPADLHDPVAGERVKAGGFRIHHDLTHWRASFSHGR